MSSQDENLPFLAKKFVDTMDALITKPIKYGLTITVVSNVMLYFTTVAPIAAMLIFIAAFGITITFLGVVNEANKFYTNKEDKDKYRDEHMSMYKNMSLWNPERIELRPNT